MNNLLATFCLHFTRTLCAKCVVAKSCPGTHTALQAPMLSASLNMKVLLRLQAVYNGYDSVMMRSMFESCTHVWTSKQSGFITNLVVVATLCNFLLSSNILWITFEPGVTVMQVCRPCCCSYGIMDMAALVVTKVWSSNHWYPVVAAAEQLIAVNWPSKSRVIIDHKSMTWKYQELIFILVHSYHHAQRQW